MCRSMQVSYLLLQSLTSVRSNGSAVVRLFGDLWCRLWTWNITQLPPSVASSLAADGNCRTVILGRVRPQIKLCFNTAVV